MAYNTTFPWLSTGTGYRIVLHHEHGILIDTLHELVALSLSHCGVSVPLQSDRRSNTTPLLLVVLVMLWAQVVD